MEVHIKYYRLIKVIQCRTFHKYKQHHKYMRAEQTNTRIHILTELVLASHIICICTFVTEKVNLDRYESFPADRLHI